MKVRLLRIDRERSEAWVIDEADGRWRIHARDVDGDRRFARAAWTTLLEKLPERFEAEPIPRSGDARRATLNPHQDVVLRLPGGERLAGRYKGWNSRGNANWHAIKHALHARALARGTGGSKGRRARKWPVEDWPADPAETEATLKAIHAATGCRVHRWAQRPQPPACTSCNPEHQATCLGIIYEAGWLPLDRATRAALRWASDPDSRTEGMVHRDPRHRRDGRADDRVIVFDETGTKVVLARRGGDRPAFHSVTTYKLVPRKAAETARQRGNLAAIARARAAEAAREPDDQED